MRESKYARRAKPLSGCTPDELQKTYAAARKHAVSNGRPLLADDFASFLMEDLVRQGTLYYRLDWRWAQFLRTTLGNLRHKKGAAKAKANDMGRVDIEKLRHIEDETLTRADAPDLVNRVAAAFSGRERACIVLKYKWDMTLDEIGQVFGTSKARIGQILDKCHAEIRRKGIVMPTPKPVPSNHKPHKKKALR